jgi:hypothetical protein
MWAVHHIVDADPGAFSRNMIRSRHAGAAIALADEATLRPKAGRHEPCVADDAAVQAQELIEIDQTAAGFADSVSRTLDTIPAALRPMKSDCL